MRSNSEYQANNTNKRGIVVDRDPKKMRVKVSFEDEDETVSHWIDVLSSSSVSNKSFNMPDVDDEVWCAMDAKGEDGCLLGSKFNDKDTPANQGNDDMSLSGPWGSIHVDKGSGAMTIQLNGNAVINASGGIELVSPTLTHNGTDISDQHKHKDVEPGPSLTGIPV